MGIRGIDLFCGGGGSSWGARLAGVEIVGAVDAWDVAARNYKHNFPDTVVRTERLDESSGAQLLGDLGPVDLVIASPECTSHSVARGSRPRCEESRRSAWYVMRFIREMKPRWIVLENVTSMRGWSGYPEFLAALGRDYHLRAQALDAADFGVPQRRRRLFVLGDRMRQPDPIAPLGGALRTASDILDPPGTWPAGPAFWARRAPATVERIKRGMTELGEGRDFLVVYYSSDKAGGWQPLDRPLRTLTTLDRFGLVQWIKGQPTLRMLQIPELKRAMGFRDSAGEQEYELVHGTRRDKVKILGNGVCPPVMEGAVRSLVGSEESSALAAKP